MSLSLLRHKCFDLSRRLPVKDYLRISSCQVQLSRRFSTETDDRLKRKFDLNVNKKDLPEGIRIHTAAEQWEKMTRKEKLFALYKDYGKTIIIFHIMLSSLSLGIVFLLVKNGMDFTSVIEYLTEESREKFDAVTINASTFVVAYAIHKLFAPIRISMTIIFAPILVRFFRRYGLIKSALPKTIHVKK